jgi:hypothetical protein
MAKCFKSEPASQPSPVIPKATFRLELNQDEAACLSAIFAYVGGSPDNSGRAHIDNISHAMRKSGVLDHGDHRNYYSKALCRSHDGIRFADGIVHDCSIDEEHG